MIYRLWKKTGYALNKFAAWFITFNFINITWIFFRAKSFSDAEKVLSAMFDLSSFSTYVSDKPFWRIRYFLTDFHIKSNTFYMLLIIIVLCTVLPNAVNISNRLLNLSKRNRLYLSAALAVSSALLLLKMAIVPYSEFIYFNF